MKKLTTVQWFAFAFAAAGLIVAQLEQYGVSVQIIGGVSSALGTLKLIYDLYMSFSQAEAMNIANNVQNQTSILEKQVNVKLYTKEDLRKLAK